MKNKTSLDIEKTLLKNKKLFKFSIIYTTVMALILIVTILVTDYYNAGLGYSNYLFFSLGGSILIASLITTISGWDVHSKNERILLIALHVSMVFIGICIILDEWYPVWGVIGYSATYLLIAIYWISAMYFFGYVGKKYASKKKLESIIKTKENKKSTTKVINKLVQKKNNNKISIDKSKK